MQETCKGFAGIYISYIMLHWLKPTVLLVHTWYSIQKCSLVEIELHYAAHQLNVQSVRGFMNGGHHFSAAESGLHTNIESSCNTISCLASCSAIIVSDSQHFILLLAEYIITFVVQCSAVAIYGLFFSQYVSTTLQLSRTKANHSRVCSTCTVQHLTKYIPSQDLPDSVRYIV